MNDVTKYPMPRATSYHFVWFDCLIIFTSMSPSANLETGLEFNNIFMSEECAHYPSLVLLHVLCGWAGAFIVNW